MLSTKSDNKTQERCRADHLRNSLTNTSSSNTQQSRLYDAKRASFDRGKILFSSSSQRESELQRLVQRCIRILPLMHHTAIRLHKSLWLLCSQHMFPCHKLTPAAYQQSSTTIRQKIKITTTTRSVNNVISWCSNNSSKRTQRRHKRTLTYAPSCYSILLKLLVLLLFWFSHLIGSSCAAPQSCVLCDISDLKDQASSNAHAYEEYHFEHQVTRMDAITALKTFNVSDYGEPSGCAIQCTDKVMKYCLGPQFINDHCWCELGHTEEGLPFVPHICYVGEKLYKATVGSCYFYEQVKECCCAPALAKQWRHISVATRQIQCSSLLILTILPLIFNAACRHKHIF